MRYFWLTATGLILTFFIAGKVWSQYMTQPEKKDRFELVFVQQLGSQLGIVQVILDKETGVKYLYYKYGFGASLTKLEEKESK